LENPENCIITFNNEITLYSGEIVGYNCQDYIYCLITDNYEIVYDNDENVGEGCPLSIYSSSSSSSSNSSSSSSSSSLGSSSSSSSSSDFNGLILHLDANSITGLSDNDPLGSWNDESIFGNDAIQTSHSNRPVYKTNVVNSLPAIQFTKTSSQFITVPDDNSLDLDNLTIFLVFKFNSTSTWESILAHDEGPGVTEKWIIGKNISGGGFQLHKNGSTGSGFATASGALSTNFELRTISRNASTGEVKLYLNGTAGGTATFASFPTSIGSFIEIGRSEAQAYMDGYVAEILIYNSLLSDTLRESIENDLITKYNL
jgi:LysM repeat protein